MAPGEIENNNRWVDQDQEETSRETSPRIKKSERIQVSNGERQLRQNKLKTAITFAKTP